MKVGSKVICINADFSNYPGDITRHYQQLPVQDDKYVVRAVTETMIEGKIVVRILLEELKNKQLVAPEGFLFEPGFDASRFRELEDDKFMQQIDAIEKSFADEETLIRELELAEELVEI